MAKYQQQPNTNQFQIEEGTVAEKTNYVENLNRLIAHTNHVSVYPTMGSYAEAVSQLDAMLEAYKDEKYQIDFNKLKADIEKRMSKYAPEEKTAWLEENQTYYSRELFRILMRLMSRSGLSPTGRISSIDNGNI